MALGWNEVKERALRFSKEWEDASNEESEAMQLLTITGVTHNNPANSLLESPCKKNKLLNL
jgi:hypothetical protein